MRPSCQILVLDLSHKIVLADLKVLPNVWGFSAFWLSNVLGHTAARTFFRHLNFQKWSERVRILAVWIVRVLCATAACTFAICQFPTVVRILGVLSILTSKSSSRQNGVQFFISQIARWFPFSLLWLLSPRLLHLSTWDNKLEIWLLKILQLATSFRLCHYPTRKLPTLYLKIMRMDGYWVFLERILPLSGSWVDANWVSLPSGFSFHHVVVCCSWPGHVCFPSGVSGPVMYFAWP